jgi:adenylosuccinate lyase
MKQFAQELNYEVARQREQEVRHDVMAHLHAYCEQCPLAKPIIHLGATSCYVGDNTDIIVMKEGLTLIRKRLLNVIDCLQRFAVQHKSLPTLAFTHFQAAQPTTVGKRACLWIQDLLLDFELLDYHLLRLKLLGCKGATGTQASFLALFHGDHAKCRELDRLICEKMGFPRAFAVSGQTYPRKVDSEVLAVLCGIAQSAAKFSSDLRLLQHLKQIEEPYEADQIGSSAMPYKRNPMRSERIASLARYVIVDALNPSLTAASQWFERTLDDSANKRLAIPEAFLAVDGILLLYANIAAGLVVYPNVIRQHLTKELPFIATENILMRAVEKGGDYQELHERLRKYSIEAGNRVKQSGLENNLCELVAADPAFEISLEELNQLLDPMNFVGRAVQQVDEFLANEVAPIPHANEGLLGAAVELTV